MKPVRFRRADGEGPRLEGRLHLPDGLGPFPGAVICHPHSLYGGSMDVPLMVGLAEGLARAGWAALRFNFRGVGGSEGSFGEGVGEVEDAAAALAFLAGQPSVESKGLALVGYSFGALVGLEAARHSPQVGALVAIGLPLGNLPEGWLSDCALPKLFIAGDGDHLCPAGDLRKWARSLVGPAEVVVLPDADHYLFGREAQAVEAVVRFLQAHRGPESRRSV